jgi:hypothetical protein
MAAKVSLSVKALVAPGMRAFDLLPRGFVLEHVTTKIVDTLKSFVAFVAMEPGILCCGLDSAWPV